MSPLHNPNIKFNTYDQNIPILEAKLWPLEKIELPKSKENIMISQSLIEYFENEFVPKMVEQLKADQLRWGDTWLNRTREGQEDRVMGDYNDYYDKFKFANQPMPWLKVIGNAVITQCREDHPDWFPGLKS